MPSLWKRITFSVASALCVGSVVLGRILCKTAVELVNAPTRSWTSSSGTYYGLFQGGKTKKCGLGDRLSVSFGPSVFPKLVQTLNSGLHMMVILFLLAAVGFAVVSLSFCIYNARKVPYQSIKGHKGLYLWNFIAGTWKPFISWSILVRHHSLTDRVANYRENLLSSSSLKTVWTGLSGLAFGSIGTHFAVCGVVAMSRIKLPKPEIKKPEEPTISALDLLY
uniref:Clarin 2 n=1 Tax=Salarias fasciatus TaxID=181472 RepID=A0A672H035_SALFA